MIFVIYMNTMIIKKTQCFSVRPQWFSVKLKK